MLNNKKITIVMPAYNAGTTLYDTYKNIPKKFVDDIILVDDCSKDNTLEIAKKLGIKTISHSQNLGYGANQKTCYNYALESGADIIIMLHPDGQYEPKLIPAIVTMLAYNNYNFIIASRFLNNSAKKSKMPRYKYFANRFLTKLQNLVFNQGLSEYHSGYRAYTRDVLKSINYRNFSNDFIFDNEMMASICLHNYSIGEISTPCKYFKEASSIGFFDSVKYGFGVLRVTFQYLFGFLK